jgi:DNA-directed RNA polymerase subunit RPC12/RpoP
MMVGVQCIDMSRKELSEASGPVNAEVVANVSKELRTTDCMICGAKQSITERAVGTGLKTVIKCTDCGFEYATRGE